MLSGSGRVLYSEKKEAAARPCVEPEKFVMRYILIFRSSSRRLMKLKTHTRTYDLTILALFASIILLFAFVPGLGYIPLGFTRATTLHIPVIIGSIVLGPKKGGLLGAVFGLTSLVNNTMFPTVTSFVFSPFYSVGGMSGNALSLVICFVPRILTGVVPYFVYKLIMRLSKTNSKEKAALVTAGFLGSMTNTLLVMNMIYLFFGETYAQATNRVPQLLYGAILSVIGINGIPEAVVAAILVTAVVLALNRLPGFRTAQAVQPNTKSDP